MKKILFVTLAAAVLYCLAPSCSKNNDVTPDEESDSRVDDLMNRVATLEEQTAQLSSSIETLTEEHQKLQSFTVELSKKVAEMETELATVDSRIAAVKSELEGKMTAQKTELIGMLEDYKTEVKGKIDEINGQIKALQDQDAELVKKIETLQKFVKDSMVTKDWATATFATLRQKDSLAGVTAKIDVYARYVSGRVDSLATEHHKDTATIFTAIRALDTKSSKALETAVQTLNNTITTTAATIKTEYTAAIKTAVENSEASIKQWVNDTLNDYYTAAEIDAMIAIAKGRIDSLATETTGAKNRITTLETTSSGHTTAIKNIRDSLNTAYTRIQTVRDSLKTLDYKIDTTREKITAAYTSAIKDSLGQLRLVLNDSLTSVKTSISTLSGDLTAVTTRVTTLEGQMTTVRDSIQTLQAEIAGLRVDVDKLIARIQKIDVIPDYGDGSVNLNNGWNLMNFSIRPDSLAEKLADGFAANETKFTFLMVQTLTKAVTYDSLDVEKVAYVGNGTLEVTVRGDKIPSYYYAQDGKTGNGCLIISDKVNCSSSGYFSLSRAVYPEQKNALCTNVKGIIWAPVNCGYHATNYKYGKLYQWGRKDGCGYNSTWTESGTTKGPETVIQATSTTTTPIAASSESATTFYKIASSPYDWLSSKNDLRWNSGTEVSPVKTQYDPCPSGWRVPTYDELYALIGSSGSISSSAGWDGAKNGYWFNGTNKPKSGKGLFLPAAGYRRHNYGDCFSRVSYGYYMSSSVDGSSARCLDLCSGGTNMSTCYRAYGHSVRCVQE